MARSAVDDDDGVGRPELEPVDPVSLRWVGETSFSALARDAVGGDGRGLPAMTWVGETSSSAPARDADGWAGEATISAPAGIPSALEGDGVVVVVHDSGDAAGE